MARVARPMRKDNNGRPVIGTASKSLGVRPIGQHADVDLLPPGDLAGNVVRNGKGLSVTEDWRTLPGHLIPLELDDRHNGASGRNMAVFVHGTGPVVEAPVANGLELVLKAGSLNTGVIGPVATVPLAQFQANLAATEPDWVEDPS